MASRSPAKAGRGLRQISTRKGRQHLAPLLPEEGCHRYGDGGGSDGIYGSALPITPTRLSPASRSQKPLDLADA